MRRYQDIANNEMYADMESPDEIMMQKDPPTPCGTPADKGVNISGIIRDRLFDLINFARTRPQAWEVLEIKLRNPGISQRQIAKEIGLSEGTVRNYLKDAEKTIPGLKAVLNGGRSNPPTPSGTPADRGKK